MGRRSTAWMLVAVWLGMASSAAWSAVAVDLTKRGAPQKPVSNDGTTTTEEQKRSASLRKRLIEASGHLRSHRWDEAIKAYEVIAKDYPKTPAAGLCAIERAYALAKKGKKDEALAILAAYGQSNSHLAPLASAMIARLRGREIHLHGRLIHRPDQGVNLNLYRLGLPAVQCRLYRIGLKECLAAHHPFEEPVGRKPVKAWKLGKGNPLDGNSGKVGLGKLAAGVYVLEVGAEGMRRWHPVMVTDLTLTGYSLGSTKYLLATGPDGNPAGGLEVTLIDWRGKPVRVRLGDDGVAIIKCSGNVLAVAESGWGPGLLLLSAHNRLVERNGRVVRCYTYTDRAVYRPGQKVRFRGVIREVNAGRLRLPKENLVEVSLKDSGNRLVAKIERKLSDWGTFDGVFLIGERCMCGDFTIETRLLPVPEGCQQACARTSFAVEAYRRPEIKVVVRPQKSRLSKGESTAVQVHATYFHRSPVVGARLNWQLVGEGARFISGDRYGYNLKTDAQGKLSFTIKAGEPKGATECKLRVSLQSASRRVYQGHAVLKLDGPAGDMRADESRFRIECKEGPYYVGENCQVRIHAPVACKRAVLIVEGRELDGIHAVALKEGRGELALAVKEAYLGGITFRVEARGAGGVLRTSRSVPVLPKNAAAKVSLLVDRERYGPGDEAVVRLLTQDRDGQPVRAEVSAGLVDGAMYAIAEETITPMHSFFYPSRPERALACEMEMLTSFERHFHGYSTHGFYVEAEGDNSPAFQFQDSNDLPLSGLLPHAYLATEQQELVVNAPAQSGGGFDRGPLIGPRAHLFRLLRLPWLGIVASSHYLGVSQGQQDEQQPVFSPSLPGSGPRPVPKIFYEGRLRMGRSARVTGRIRRYKGGSSTVVVSPFGGKARTFFPDIAAWHPAVRTDEKGMAELRLRLPDTITAWRLTARAVTASSAFSNARQGLRVEKPLFFTSQHPRVLREGDETTVSAIIHASDSASGNVTLAAKGLKLLSPASQPFRTDGMRTVRVDWKVAVTRCGVASIEIRDDKGRDAIRETIDIKPLGMPIALSASAAGKNEAILVLPRDYDATRWRATCRWLPDLHQVVAMSMKKLAAFPYGCVEQTMSRFAPDVVVADALKKGIEDASLNRKLTAMVSKGAQALYGYQNRDGGWGWFREGKSAPFMTAYVMWGLSTVADCGHTIDKAVLVRGRTALLKLLRENKHPDARAYMLFALSAAETYLGEPRTDTKALAPAATELSSYGTALLCLAAQTRGEREKVDACLRSLKRRAKQNGGLVHWPAPSKSDHLPNTSDVEATAYALRALVRAGRHHDLISGAVAWLRLRCDSEGWTHTKATSAAIFGLAEHLRTSKRWKKGDSVSLLMNGQAQPGSLVPGMETGFNGTLLKAGENRIGLRGDAVPKGGVLIVAVDGWTADRKIAAGGRLGRLQRTFRAYTTKEAPPRPASAKKEKGPIIGRADSGKEILVELELDAPRRVAHAVLVDPVPSGCEIVEMSWDPYQGLQPWRRRSTPFVHAEARDDRMVFFFRELPAGKHRVSYRLRAETPGSYRVPPARVNEMYDTASASHSSSGAFEVSP